MYKDTPHVVRDDLLVINWMGSFDKEEEMLMGCKDFDNEQSYGRWCSFFIIYFYINKRCANVLRR